MITIPVVILAWVSVVVLSPLLALLGTVTDLATGRRDLPSIRLVALAIVYLSHELIALVFAVPTWLMGGVGPNRRLDVDQRMQRWLIRSLLKWGRRIVNVRFDLPEPPDMPPGEVIVLSRHASLVDAVVPGFIFLELLDRPVHYVIKRELTKSPMFDIYGHRLDNHFVDRGSGDTERETAAISTMAGAARPGSGLIIFPEGTYATEANRRRVRASLERRGETEGLALANQLRTLLPPKTAGALALIRARTAGAVVILGHVGLEGVAEFSGLRRYLPARAPVVVRWWCHQLADLPAGDEGLATWLQEQWRTLDLWVADQKPRDQACGVTN